MGDVFEYLADVVFAMTGASPSAGNHSGRWWRRRFLEVVLAFTAVIACAIALRG